jgi:hypothetical protein
LQDLPSAAQRNENLKIKENPLVGALSMSCLHRGNSRQLIELKTKKK